MYIGIKSIPKFYKVQKSISLWLVVNTLHSNVLVLAGHSVEAQNSKLHSTLKRRPPPRPPKCILPGNPYAKLPSVDVVDVDDLRCSSAR